MNSYNPKTLHIGAATLVAIALTGGMLLASAAARQSSHPHPYGVGTAYCLQGQTSSGKYVHHGTVASVTLRPGTKIRLIGKRAFLGGRRLFTVEDTGNLASNQLDFWTPDCGAAMQWGVRKVHYKIGWGKP